MDSSAYIFRLNYMLTLAHPLNRELLLVHSYEVSEYLVTQIEFTFLACSNLHLSSTMSARYQDVMNDPPSPSPVVTIEPTEQGLIYHVNQRASARPFTSDVPGILTDT
jgi:hypothetical protein